MVEVSEVVKIIVVVIIIYIVVGLISSFKGISDNPAFKNLADAFDTLTALVSWAASHWYLFAISAVLLPFLPATLKWVVSKMSACEKSNISDPAKEVATNDVIGNAKLDQAEQAAAGSEEQKALTEESAEAYAANDGAEGKEEGDTWAEQNGVKTSDAGLKLVKLARQGRWDIVKLSLKNQIPNSELDLYLAGMK